ncbi:MAG: GNAT family N-acetyltransferase, partial [Saprospiraceae bacterium]
MTSGTSLYHEYYLQCEHPLLYAAPWWLDAVCGKEKWGVVAKFDQYAKPVSFTPYYKTHLRGMSALITPPFTQWLPELRKENAEPFALDEFINSLPASSILDITLKAGKGEVAVSSNGYRISFKYSYIIPYQEDYMLHKKKYNEGLRRNLKEAEKNYEITVSEDMDIFLRLCHSSYQQRNLKPPLWLKHVVSEVTCALKKNQCGILHLAMHRGFAIAGILTGWDSKTTYYLTGGRRGDEQ